MMLGRAWLTCIQCMMSSGWDPTGSWRLMMAATTISSGLHGALELSTRKAWHVGPHSSKLMPAKSIIQQRSSIAD